MTVLLYISSDNTMCFLSLLRASSTEHFVSLQSLLLLFSKKETFFSVFLFFFFFSLSGCHLNITRTARTDFEHLEGTDYTNKVHFGASILTS